MISHAEFRRVEMRVGRVVGVEEFPEARKPSYKLTIDFRPEARAHDTTTKRLKAFTDLKFAKEPEKETEN